MGPPSQAEAALPALDSPPLTWVEVDLSALEANARTLRGLCSPGALLAPVVKANAYGHGAVLAARAFLAGGADWLCVHSVAEAGALRAAGVEAPLLILGPVPPALVGRAVAYDARFVVYNHEVVDALVAQGLSARLHLKIETGNQRQGLDLPEALALAERIAAAPGLQIEGVSSHFANIEDTTDHSFARTQLMRFEEAVGALRAAGHPVPIRHIANSAATLLWPEQHFELVRVGLAAYGLWPSNETLLAATLAGRGSVALRPALTWKATVAQVKWVPEGAPIGYGCTFRTTHPTRIAVLAVGYADGYDRRLSNVASVLVGGRRAPVRGRVCMNLLMVDVTHVPDVRLGQPVVLLGRQGDDEVTAEELARLVGTINYEIVTRIAACVTREPVRNPLTPPPPSVAWRPPRG